MKEKPSCASKSPPRPPQGAVPAWRNLKGQLGEIANLWCYLPIQFHSEPRDPDLSRKPPDTHGKTDPDRRNPFRTTLKPEETIVGWHLQGNRLIPGFLRRCGFTCLTFSPASLSLRRRGFRGQALQTDGCPFAGVPFSTPEPHPDFQPCQPLVQKPWREAGLD